MIRTIFPFLLSVFFLFIQGKTNGQNLALNGDFENYTSLPDSAGQWYDCVGISNLNGHHGFTIYGSPDYFNALGSAGFQLPNSAYGTVSPYSGNAVMGFCPFQVWGVSNYREYVAIPLSQSLIPGNKYTCTYYITTGTNNIFGVACNHIGTQFSVGLIQQLIHEPVGGTPQYEIPGIFWDSTWHKVSFTFTAAGAYNWVTFGNFYDDAQTQDSIYGCCTGTYAYYFMDDVVVTPISQCNIQAGFISALKDSICQGTVAHLSLAGNSVDSVQWQSSNTLLNFNDISGATGTIYTSIPLLQNTYFRVVADSSSCSDTSSIFKIVTIPTPTAIYNSIVSGDEVSFNSDSSTGATSYTWDFGDGITSTQPNPAHTYDSAGTYHVCLTLQNNSNCTFTICHNISIFPMGVNNIITSKEWQLYPNPFHNQIYLSTNIAGLKAETIEIYDLLGRITFSQYNINTSDNPMILDVSDLPEGIYYLQIETKDRNYMQPLIKI